MPRKHASSAPGRPPTLASVRAGIRALADPERAAVLRRFFRTGAGEYGEGDRFLGLSVPQVRRLARAHQKASPAIRRGLLASPIHEERLLALLIMVRAYGRADAAGRAALVREYLANRARVNNWDLVDSSAPYLLGAWLLEEGGLADRPRLLDELAASASLWDRRMAVLATFRFVRAGRFRETLRLAERLLGDREDLIHKAVGWMLREIGERDGEAAEAFLRRHCRAMPRTMLRYAIEKLPEPRRRAFLRARSQAGPRREAGRRR